MFNQGHFLSNTRIIKDIGSGHGYDQWKKQRLSAVALFFLYLWFIYIVYLFLVDPYQAITSILYSPLSLVIFILIIATSIYHGCLGIRVVCEDYIRNNLVRFFLLTVIYFVSVITVCFTVFMLVVNFIINI